MAFESIKGRSFGSPTSQLATSISPVQRVGEMATWLARSFRFRHFPECFAHPSDVNKRSMKFSCSSPLPSDVVIGIKLPNIFY